MDEVLARFRGVPVEAVRAERERNCRMRSVSAGKSAGPGRVRQIRFQRGCRMASTSFPPKWCGARGRTSSISC